MLVRKLNEASDAYYNGRAEMMTDFEWDADLDRLKRLEIESGIVLPESPTNRVGADNTFGQKEEHEFAALSLSKTKSVTELAKWASGRPIWLSWKLDGLTLVVTYDSGRLTKVVTRGDGHIGTNITHLAKAIEGIRSEISDTGHIVIRGEAVISYADFEPMRNMPTRAIWRRVHSRSRMSTKPRRAICNGFLSRLYIPIARFDRGVNGWSSCASWDSIMWRTN